MPAIEDAQVVEACLMRVSSDLSAITDRPVSVLGTEATRETARPAGKDRVHISFRLAIKGASGVRHGCLLLPLSEALALANYMMMVPDDKVAQRRELDEVDGITKDTLLEIASFIANSAQSAMRGLGFEDLRVGSEGCQGVRAGIRPALDYVEGDELVVGRVEMEIHEFDEFEGILVLPPIN